MKSSNHDATRGFGLLEGLLAKKRARMAESLIPPGLRVGRILDIGCGTHPFFLFGIEFSEKYGLDKAVDFAGEGVTLLKYDFDSSIPFEDGYFDAVTMLAVIEHMERERFGVLSKEVWRVLKPGGICVLTTPARWTDKLLRAMARLRLVSPVEIAEHKSAYSRSEIAAVLQAAGFGAPRLGYFEAFMNLWAAAQK